ncbi:MAG: T9SS type A sorting domain-containing protein [Bacteroidetes bacterium]|nr:T9SS type A sorting domain-containing protein [Bacteroidota bacterium]
MYSGGYSEYLNVNQGTGDTNWFWITQFAGTYNAKGNINAFKMTRSTKADLDTFYVLFDTTGTVTSVQNQIEVVSNSFKIYPNPFSSQLNVLLQNSTSLSTICLYNIVGQVVLKESFDGSSPAQINTSNLPRGLYLVRVTSCGKELNYKVIKD